jgi:hypothetical protein
VLTAERLVAVMVEMTAALMVVMMAGKKAALMGDWLVGELVDCLVVQMALMERKI